MGSRDDDPRDELTKWLDTLHKDASKIQQEFERELRNLTDSNTSSSKGPFERFKSFIDDNLSTLSEGFRRFPSNVAELRARMQAEREAAVERERSIWRAWTGSEDSPDHIRMQIDRASKEEMDEARKTALMLLQEGLRRNEGVPDEKIVALYRDNEKSFGGLDQFATPMLSNGGACYYKQETVENLPSTARWGWPQQQPQWLSAEWFKRSPYSPVRLEADLDKQEFGGCWRAPFEDLLLAALDKPMGTREKVGMKPNGRPQSTYSGPGLDWMLSLQCRGILPLQLPRSLALQGKHVYANDSLERLRLLMRQFREENVLDPRMYLSRQPDWNALVDELLIKSGPKTEAQPIAPAGTTWRVPDTEKELYEQMEGIDDEEIEIEMEQERRRLKNLYEDRVDEDRLKRLEQHRKALERLEFGEDEEEDEDEVEDEMETVKPFVKNPNGENVKSDILSQLTTTHTIRLPDGTVTTRTVFKRKFADGREEQQESFETSHEATDRDVDDRPRDGSSTPSVEEYQRQLMTLEKSYKKRLLEQRERDQEKQETDERRKARGDNEKKKSSWFWS